MITFQQAFNIIRDKDSRGAPVPFSIEFVTCNLKTKKGGEIRTMEKMVYLWPKTSGHKKNPNLFMNGVINIVPAGSSARPTAVHLILVRKINGLIVT